VKMIESHPGSWACGVDQLSQGRVGSIGTRLRPGASGSVRARALGSIGDRLAGSGDGLMSPSP
jgi:hypothetical protein